MADKSLLRSGREIRTGDSWSSRLEFRGALVVARELNDGHTVGLIEFGAGASRGQ